MNKEQAHELELDLEEALLEIEGQNEIYLHGRCHVFAIALHELTGYPLGAFLENEYGANGRPRTCLVHAFVKVDGAYVDIRGVHKTATSFLEEFPIVDFDGPWEEAITESELLKLGTGKSKRTKALIEELASLRGLAAEVWGLTQQVIEVEKVMATFA